jgi:hypothetical protein
VREYEARRREERVRRVKLEIVELEAEEEWSSSTPASTLSAASTLCHLRAHRTLGRIFVKISSAHRSTK